MNLSRALVASVGLVVTALAEDPAATLSLTKTIPLERVQGRIDHLAADVKGERLFVAALGNNTVEVLDLNAGRLIESLSGFSEPQGIAYVAEFDRVFVANGGDGTCRILEGSSLKTVTTVPCGEDADNVRYDQAAKRVYVGYGSGALAVLDAKTGAKIAEIKLAGHPESFQLESGGKRLFVNVPKADQIAVVDREKAEVIATWPLKEARSNYPLCLDEANRRLFTGCRNPARVLVYDFSARNGRLVASVPISGDTDDLFYDWSNKLLYVSCGQGAIEVISQRDADQYQKLTSIHTAPGARTSLFVPELKLFCLAVPRRGNQRAEVQVFKTH